VWKVQLFAYNVILVNPGFKPGIRQLQYFMSHHERGDLVGRGDCERTLGEMLRMGQFGAVSGPWHARIDLAAAGDHVDNMNIV
jgi:hypothetical protein